MNYDSGRKAASGTCNDKLLKDSIMEEQVKETAWSYCRECDKFDKDGSGTCMGKPFDYEIVNGKPPCSNYSYEE